MVPLQAEFVSKEETKMKDDVPPRVVIIGGGVAGLMSAYFLRQEMPHGQITVLEKGHYIPYQFGTSTRSAACTRQQFGCEHNVQMSMFSTRFYERFAEHTGEQSPMLYQKGYLFLYRDDRWQIAQDRVKIQYNLGLTDVRALSVDEIRKEFPLVHEDHGLRGGTFCPTDGFLDPNIILTALRDWLKEAGVRIRTNSEVVGFSYNQNRVSGVELSDGHVFCADYVVNATGPWASRIARMLGTNLPVGPEKRYLWTAEFRDPADDLPDTEFRKVPMIVCWGDGMTPYLKPEPGRNPHAFTMGCEHPTDPVWDFMDEQQDEVENGYHANDPEGYHVRAWQELATWVPFAEKFGFLKRTLGGFYETTPDHNPFIDFDPNCPNVVHCVGFSGHGIMHGPAAGRTVADLLKFGEYQTFPSGKRNLSFAGFNSPEGREVETMKI